MKCCTACFQDAFIRASIENHGVVGDCDFCGSKDTFIYDISDSSNPISESIVGLVQTYLISDDAKAKPLKDALRNDWDVFALEAEAMLSLVKKLCAAYYPENAEIFSKKVIIEQLFDNDFLRDFGVVSGYSWSEFAESIKYSNRFHSGMFNPEQFASFLSILQSLCPKNARMYRARIASGKAGFTVGEMGVPPKNQRTAGRINPDGVGVLYLASDKLTALNEVHAIAFDYITIGEFQAKDNIKTVNLSGFDNTSPFSYGGEIEKFAANRKVFQEIAAEIAKPLRRSDNPLEYLPTQYIAEFIKSQNYDGVEYASTLKKGGHNLAVFQEELFECVSVETIEVSEILYQTTPEFLDS